MPGTPSCLIVVEAQPIDSVNSIKMLFELRRRNRDRSAAWRRRRGTNRNHLERSVKRPRSDKWNGTPSPATTRTTNARRCPPTAHLAQLKIRSPWSVERPLASSRSVRRSSATNHLMRQTNLMLTPEVFTPRKHMNVFRPILTNDQRTESLCLKSHGLPPGKTVLARN